MKSLPINVTKSLFFTAFNLFELSATSTLDQIRTIIKAIQRKQVLCMQRVGWFYLR